MYLIALIVLCVFATALVVVIGLNFVPTERKLEHEVLHRQAIDSEQFRREMGVLLGPNICPGNLIQPLENGDEIFPAMLDAIRAATRSITFETFIYWSGEMGRTFADALAERARAGVKIHVLLDWVGSHKMKPSLLAQMVDAGAQVERYHPLRWYTLARMNNRTHRKLLVVDGRIGFTGGVGIADLWRGHAQDPAHWRDVHFRIEGPVVGQIQAVFMSNWIKASDHVLQGEDYFPKLQPAGDHSAQMFSSSVAGGSESMQLMYLVVLAAAAKSIDLSAAYFVPEHLTRKVLIDAMRRGVKLRVLTPGPHIDSAMAREASRSQWGELLEAGALMHEYQPSMIHNKLMIVDGLLTSVGSTNFDNRSFSLNDEASLNVYDTAFAERMAQVFERDLQRCRQITLEMWQRRPWIEKVRDHVVDLIASQL